MTSYRGKLGGDFLVGRVVLTGSWRSYLLRLGSSSNGFNG